jgi:hypothetical protein
VVVLRDEHRQSVAHERRQRDGAQLAADAEDRPPPSPPAMTSVP